MQQINYSPLLTLLCDAYNYLRNLPHDLVAAFRSTLQETIDADLLLHVIDSHDEQREFYREQVNQVIAEIGAEKVPQIEVMNKIDLGGQEPHVEEGDGANPTRVYLSAHHHLGLDQLLHYLGNYFSGQIFQGDLRIPPQHARLRARLYADNAVREESITENGEFFLNIAIDQQRLDHYLRDENLSLADL